MFKRGDKVVTVTDYITEARRVIAYEGKVGKVVKAGEEASVVAFEPHGRTCSCCNRGPQEVEVPNSYLAIRPAKETGFTIGSAVTARTTIRFPDGERAALKGDKGVIVAASRSVLEVKFDPIFPKGGSPHGFVAYRRCAVSLTDVVLDVTPSVELADAWKRRDSDSDGGFYMLIRDREVRKSMDERELISRLQRLDLILADAETYAEKLVKERFVQSWEMDALLTAVLNSKKTMRFPWSEIPQTYQKLLLSAGTPEQAVESVMRLYRTSSDASQQPEHDPTTDSVKLHGPRELLRAVCLWGRAKRRFIRVSEQSQETLMRVAVERAAYGLHVCHWNYLSAPGGELVEYGEGIMFQWDMMKAGTGNHTMTFSAPRGVFMGEYLEFLWWQLGEASDLWWKNGFAHVWRTVNCSYNVARLAYEDEVAREMLRLRNIAAEAGEPITREQAAEAVLARPRFKLVHMTVNLIAAMHNFQKDVVLREEKSFKPSRKKLGKRELSVLQVTLDDSGLYTWAETWCSEAARREAASGGHGGIISIHPRKAHMTHVWVLEKNLRPGETVVEVKSIKTKKGVSQLHRVYRSRKGSTPGSGKLRENEARVRRGVDDLDVKGSLVNPEAGPSLKVLGRLLDK